MNQKCNANPRSDLPALLARIIASHETSPVDFIGSGDAVDTQTYLGRAQPSYLRTLQDMLACHPQGLQGVRVLEIGAYLGVVSEALAALGAEVTAYDLPAYAENPRLKERLQRAGVRSVSGDLRQAQLDFPSAAFDVVVMCETLEHLNFNPVPSLAEMNRVLASDGRLYLGVPNLVCLSNRKRMLLGISYRNPISNFFDQLDVRCDFAVGIHWREFTRSEVHELLGRLGFTIERSYFHFSPGDRCLPTLVYRLWPASRPNITVLARRIRPAEIPPRSERYP